MTLTFTSGLILEGDGRLLRFAGRGIGRPCLRQLRRARVQLQTVKALLTKVASTASADALSFLRQCGLRDGVLRRRRRSVRDRRHPRARLAEAARRRPAPLGWRRAKRQPASRLSSRSCRGGWYPYRCGGCRRSACRSCNGQSMKRTSGVAVRSAPWLHRTLDCVAVSAAAANQSDSSGATSCDGMLPAIQGG